MIAALVFALGCGGTRTQPSEPRECVLPAEPDLGERAVVLPLEPSRIRVTVEVPKRRIEDEVRAAMPAEASGSEQGSALFARWQADWRVVPEGRPRVSLARGRVRAEADASLDIRGRVGGTNTRCTTKVHVRVDGRVRLRPDWTVALEDPQSRTGVDDCRLTGFPLEVSGILQPIAEREVERGLARATKEPISIRGAVATGWDEMARDREVGPILVRARPESIGVGEPTCGDDVCTIDLEIAAAPEAWIDAEPPEPDRARPLPEARSLGAAASTPTSLRARLHLPPRALALLATLPDAEGEGDGARTAELRMGARPFVTIRDAAGRGLAHLPVEIASAEGGLVVRRGRDGAGLAWPADDDPCLGRAGRQLAERLARPHTARLPGEDLVALLEDARIDGLEVRHELVGVLDGRAVVDVVARARRVVVRVESLGERSARR